MPSNDTENIYSTEYGGQGAPIPASKISYDNTESGLQATKVQGAIDELAGNITDLAGDDIAYDNTDSGLQATNVQGAIDEIAGDVATLTTTVGNITNLPALPSDATAGTYVLKATKVDDTVTYAWVLEV
jgi:hypothetical protein